MYEDLEAIANLKYGEAIEKITRDGQAGLSAQGDAEPTSRCSTQLASI